MNMKMKMNLLIGLGVMYGHSPTVLLSKLVKALCSEYIRRYPND